MDRGAEDRGGCRRVLPPYLGLHSYVLILTFMVTKDCMKFRLSILSPLVLQLRF